MIYLRSYRTGTLRLRNLPSATRKVNASRFAWITSVLRLKVAA